MDFILEGFDDDTDDDIGRRRRGRTTHLARATDISARTVDGVDLGGCRKGIRSVVDRHLRQRQTNSIVPVDADLRGRLAMGETSFSPVY